MNLNNDYGIPYLPLLVQSWDEGFAVTITPIKGKAISGVVGEVDKKEVTLKAKSKKSASITFKHEDIKSVIKLEKKEKVVPDGGST